MIIIIIIDKKIIKVVLSTFTCQILHNSYKKKLKHKKVYKHAK